jgi:hypothetical protein
MTVFRLAPAAVLACLLAMPLPALAQAPAAGPNTRGLVLGFHASGATITVEDQSAEESADGGGFGIRLGWGFTPLFSLQLVGDAADVESDDPQLGEFQLSHGDLLARFSFARGTRSWVPYLEVGAGGRTATIDNFQNPESGEVGELEIFGPAFSIGGGLQWYVAPSVAIDLGLRLTAGEFTSIKFENVTIEDVLELDATSTRIALGVNWYPMTSRYRR